MRTFPPDDEPKLVGQRKEAAIAIAMEHRELAEKVRRREWRARADAVIR